VPAHATYIYSCTESVISNLTYRLKIKFKVTAFWEVMQCKSVDRNKCSGGKAPSSFRTEEVLSTVYRTTWHYIPKTMIRVFPDIRISNLIIK
jgi:hypothetical protein